MGNLFLVEQFEVTRQIGFEYLFGGDYDDRGEEEVESMPICRVQIEEMNVFGGNSSYGRSDGVFEQSSLKADKRPGGESEKEKAWVIIIETMMRKEKI
ncbi:2909_t:CDS:2 [Scutellospora calospora]|uniref:2909_t:CDS:1 n=1 Tax=Scutellospora calospora TaxID=85575 RepID=A0ACA9JY91_9GLOM|nr:2909_t:CDS:2 [Scutellospora calospora]